MWFLSLKCGSCRLTSERRWKKLENYIISICSFQLPNSVDCALAKVGNLINLIKTQPQKKKKKKKGNKQLDDQNKFATELIAIRDEWRWKRWLLIFEPFIWTPNFNFKVILLFENINDKILKVDGPPQKT